MVGYDMSWYFDQAIKSNAILLDGANLDNKSFPLFTVFKNELIKNYNDTSKNN